MAYNANPPYTKTPLTEQEKALTSLPSGVLPSGEANFFDAAQYHKHNGGDGINATFPSPDSFKVDQPGQSGLYVTNPENPDLVVGENGSEFEPSGLVNQFSNGYASRLSGITDFTIFNPYIHYYAVPAPATSISLDPPPLPIRIPYISDYEVSETLEY
ncbi:hypothetical protein OAF28_01000 [Akkermansiaceae bacterium]|nr:hypothetical protein [Akkermansiaceae bacterium]